MAKLIYALSGQGRGHTSRVLAISDELRRRGHQIRFCCGGTAREILESRGERVLGVPALRQVVEGNQVKFFRTISCNWSAIVHRPEIIARLADEIRDYGADLVITDFEAFSPRAAARLGLPVISFNHQQVVTETSYALPRRYWLDAKLTEMAVRLVAPRRPEHILLTSFFFPEVKDPSRTTLVAPIIRPDVQSTHPSRGEDILVYYNQTEGAEHVPEVLRQVDASFILYNFPMPEDPDRFPNLRFKAPSMDDFLYDLARCRAILCTAGFTLISEALYLGKPLLVVPNRGIFEQTLNALFLEQEGLGAAVIDRPIAPEDVRSFLACNELYEARLQGRRVCGNEEAVRCIESILERHVGTYQPCIAVSENGSSWNTTAPVSADRSGE